MQIFTGEKKKVECVYFRLALTGLFFAWRGVQWEAVLDVVPGVVRAHNDRLLENGE